jgi:pSer/pThr/pTyr-binding forkhead associated (FHA) protein
MSPNDTALSRRLRQAREARETQEEIGQPDPASGLKQSSCWLTIPVSGRHIALPQEGELVLGRLDLNFGLPPDVDLSYEDRRTNTISRRHAKIIGLSGYHILEDMGSSRGVYVNGRRVGIGDTPQLRPDDRIALGSLQMHYDRIPAQLLNSQGGQARHTLFITTSGRRLSIAPPQQIVIGHADPHIGFKPDIDLGGEGEVGLRVSRRHAAISWRKSLPYLEDLGSGFGTRLNGTMVLIGQVVPLKPGDHIWLGGCVLAYDVELSIVP